MRIFVSAHALGFCAALFLGLLAPELAAQCQRCGTSDTLTGKDSSHPEAIGDIRVRHEDIAHLAEQMPLTYSLLRTLTQQGRRGLDIGYFEGTRAISSSQAPDDMELDWRFAGFVEHLDDEMSLHVELDGHETFETLTLILAVNPELSTSSDGGRATATRVDGSRIAVNW